MSGGFYQAIHIGRKALLLRAWLRSFRTHKTILYHFVHVYNIVVLGVCLANIAVVNEVSNEMIRRQGIPLPPQDVQFCVEQNRETADRVTQSEGRFWRNAL
jgi:hypothetical protein